MYWMKFKISKHLFWFSGFEMAPIVPSRPPITKKMLETKLASRLFHSALSKHYSLLRSRIHVSIFSILTRENLFQIVTYFKINFIILNNIFINISFSFQI